MEKEYSILEMEVVMKEKEYSILQMVTEWWETTFMINKLEHMLFYMLMGKYHKKILVK